MFLHFLQPQILEDLPSDPLHTLDLRTLTDERLAEAAGWAILPEWTQVWQRLDHKNATYGEVADLMGSILRRVTRVIVQSTRIARLMEDNDFRLERLDELLESMTLAFIHMVGAFDAIAIVNGLLSGQTRYPDFAWQRPQFRNAIRTVAPAAAALMDDSTAGDLYFRAIRAFRNTIHRRMPDVGTSVRDGGDPAHAKAILALESNGHQEIIETFTRAGWTKYVGIDLAEPGYLFLRPGTAVGLLMNDGIPLLNALLAATPADILGPVQFALDTDATLYSLRMQQYAVEYLHLTHLLPESN